MKFFKIILLIAIISPFVFSLSKNLLKNFKKAKTNASNTNNSTNKTTNQRKSGQSLQNQGPIPNVITSSSEIASTTFSKNPVNDELAKIHMYIKEEASKKGRQGALSGGKNGLLNSEMYPQNMVKRAKNSRTDKTLYGFMNDPTEVYSFCINPFKNINYVEWCKNNKLDDSRKVVNCELSFCNVCCDTLEMQYDYLSKEGNFGQKLGLGVGQGQEDMKNAIIKASNIDECKKKCQVSNINI